MRLRKMLRGRGEKAVKFQEEWKEAGLSVKLSNKGIKRYLSGLKSNDTLSETVPSTKPSNTLACED